MTTADVKLAESYFQRVGPTTYRATSLVEGAWDTSAQHIAPALGLLAHAVELDRDKRSKSHLVVARLSYDILGTLPIDAVEVTTTVVRPGRTIELVEAVLKHDDRPVVRLRAWLMQPAFTEEVSGSAFSVMPPPSKMPPWNPSEIWPGKFIASLDIRRDDAGPGRARYWARSCVPLIADEKVGPTADVARILDLANGMAVRADPDRVAFPNIDLTAHLFAEPRGEWIGFDTSVSFGPRGLGLTHSVLHDEHGPIGTMAQMLTVRPISGR